MNRFCYPFYIDILDKCGYSEKLTFEKKQYTQKKQEREGETSDTTHHLEDTLKPILQNNC